MTLSRSGRAAYARIAALLAWLAVGAGRGGDRFGAVAYGAMALTFAVPALVGRDSLTAHAGPVPCWLRWLHRAPAPGSHTSG